MWAGFPKSKSGSASTESIIQHRSDSDTDIVLLSSNDGNADVDISDNDAMRNVYISGMLLLLFSLIAIVVYFMFFCESREDRCQRSHLSNLKNLGCTIGFYASNFGGYLPQDLGVLLDYGIITENFFICDGVSDTPKPKTGDEIRGGFCDYIYFGNNALRREEYPDDVPLVISKPGIYKDGTIHVLYGDGCAVALLPPYTGAPSYDHPLWNLLNYVRITREDISKSDQPLPVTAAQGVK